MHDVYSICTPPPKKSVNKDSKGKIEGNQHSITSSWQKESIIFIPDYLVLSTQKHESNGSYFAGVKIKNVCNHHSNGKKKIPRVSPSDKKRIAPKSTGFRRTRKWTDRCLVGVGALLVLDSEGDNFWCCERAIVLMEEILHQLICS